MASKLYTLLSGMGYHHPLHPALTHLPVGLTVAAFIFIVLAYRLKVPKYAQSAHHCAVLALLAAIPTAMVGYLDWQHFYGGSYLFAIKVKLGLALVLLVLLSAAVFSGMGRKQGTPSRVMVHFLALLTVIGIGYFGGELVYGKKTSALQPVGQDAADTPSVAAGAKLFAQSCSFCHFTDRTDTKVGPGLKGLFQRNKMPVSGWPASVDGVRRQLLAPYKEMPSFEDLTGEEIQALTDYMKSL